MTANQQSRKALELKPCPFCDGDVHKPEMRNGVGEWWVHCTNCDASSKMCMSAESAAHVWNRRAPRSVDINANEPIGPKGCGKLNVDKAQRHNRAQAATMTEGHLYRLYDHHRSAFWGPGAKGYQYRSGAGLFTPREAREIIVGTERGEQERFFSVEDAGPSTPATESAHDNREESAAA